MAKLRRKRKLAKRHSCGKIVQPRGEDLGQLAARMPHRAEAVVYSFPDGRIVSGYIALEEMTSEKAESPIGRYRLVGAITESQYQAALRVRHSHALAKKAIGAKRMRESIAGFALPSASSSPMDDGYAVRAINEYLEAMKYSGNKKVQNAIINCVFYEWDLLPLAVLDLQKGLFRLSKYYGLYGMGA